MKTIKYEFNDGAISEVEVSDEIYEALRAEDRPFEREEKRKQRHGLSLEMLLEDNRNGIVDDLQNLDRIIDPPVDEEQKALRLKKRQLKKLREGMSTLTDKQSSAIYKRFFLKMSFVKIAEEEGVDASTIQERTQSALKRIKKVF